MTGADEVIRLTKELCNWGRWGAEDELGTVNFISDRCVWEATKLVRTGEIVELGISLGRGGPQLDGARRFNPIHFMTALPHEDLLEGGIGVADDVLVLPLQAGTQWDSLAHLAHNGVIYGGRSAQSVTAAGAQRNSIRSISGRVATRGVLLDAARHFKVDSLEPGHGIGRDDLDAMLKVQGCDVAEGDALLVRTGFLGHCRSRGWDGFRGAAPGLDVTTLEWIHERRLAAVATDTPAVEVRPSAVPGIAIPFHAVAIPYMGLLLGEIFDLDELARRCALDRRYNFLFIAPPLPVAGGVGSPINPYAIR
jgi:kynurenine formamidase